MFDDDDLMLEDHIGRLARHIRDGADVCSTGFWHADPDPTDATKLVARRRQPPAAASAGRPAGRLPARERRGDDAHRGGPVGRRGTPGARSS